MIVAPLPDIFLEFPLLGVGDHLVKDGLHDPLLYIESLSKPINLFGSLSFKVQVLHNSIQYHLLIKAFQLSILESVVLDSHPKCKHSLLSLYFVHFIHLVLFYSEFVIFTSYPSPDSELGHQKLVFHHEALSSFDFESVLVKFLVILDHIECTLCQSIADECLNLLISFSRFLVSLDIGGEALHSFYKQHVVQVFLRLFSQLHFVVKP